MLQTQSVKNVEPPPQIVPPSQFDMDPIDYASSMTSAYQHDEFDDGKIF
jgi:hypothetical protein